jgi:nicotinamide phosphoribosyltransferase
MSEPIYTFKQLDFNPVLDTDSYKASHWLQYPEGVSSMYSYFESRGGMFHSTEFAGLQGFIEQYLLTPVTKAHVDEAVAFCEAHGEPFNKAGWMKIVDHYKGRFPVRIRAVPEGTIVPTKNVLFDIELTVPDKDIFWVVSWLETMLVRVWYATTVGTSSFFCKKAILDALEKSSDDPMGEISFKLHDFGSRGVSTNEGARIGGFAHLINFLGSDTIEGIRYANHYYGVKGGMAGFSIPAAEHSTMTMWGRGRESAAYRNMVQKYLIDRQVPPGIPKIAACVSDSWDIYNAVENIWCDELHEMVRDSGGKLVVRPDSGDPVEVLLKMLGIFERKIGMKKNLKGYKVLPPYFGIIQGDGINYESLREILHAVVEHGYSASNLAFGMGGGLLQQVNRDTSKFAFKCASAFIHEDWVDVMKDPATDPGKKSKAGHQALIAEGIGNGYGFKTVRGPRQDDLLQTVYENGALVKTYTMDDLRANSMKGLTI